MRCMRRVIVISIVLGYLLLATAAFAQLSQREYVVGIGDQLDIQVWNKAKKIGELSARVEVRTDGKITMPWLGDVQAAGLKMSLLKERLEGKALLGKYLNEPRVTITLLRSTEKIRVSFSGVISQNVEFTRGVTLGWVYQNLDQIFPNLLQLQPNLEAMTVKSAGEDLPVDPNLRLEWGDEITIPPQNPPTPTPVPKKPPVQKVFSRQEYEELLAQYPEQRALLESLFTTSDGEEYLVDVNAISAEQQAELGEEVMNKLLNREPDVMVEPSPSPPSSGIILLGIMPNLSVEGLVEAFLAIPDEDGNLLIKRVQEGEVIQAKDTSEEEDLLLERMYPETNEVLLSTGEVLSVPPKFTEIAFSGILEIGGSKEAILSNLEQRTPLQRKRFKEGDVIEEEMVLAKISKEWVLLQKGGATQLVFLRDASKRAVQSPPPAPSSPQDGLPLLPDMQESDMVPLGPDMSHPMMPDMAPLMEGPALPEK